MQGKLVMTETQPTIITDVQLHANESAFVGTVSGRTFLKHVTWAVSIHLRAIQTVLHQSVVTEFATLPMAKFATTETWLTVMAATALVLDPELLIRWLHG